MCEYHKKCEIETASEISEQVFQDKIVCKAHLLQAIREQLITLEEEFISDMEKEGVK